MTFIPYSNERGAQLALTVDKLGRIQLSAELRRKLDCHNKEINLYLFFDPDGRKIGIAKDYPGKNIKTFKFDQSRGYTIALNFLNDNDIEYRTGAVRYQYERTENGILSFAASRQYAGNKQLFRQEKNGNLEKIS
jgi:hypothetical protein